MCWTIYEPMAEGFIDTIIGSIVNIGRVFEIDLKKKNNLYINLF